MMDEIMADVHAIKDSFGVLYANDPSSFFEGIRVGEARLSAEGAEIHPPPPRTADLPVARLQRRGAARR